MIYHTEKRALQFRLTESSLILFMNISEKLLLWMLLFFSFFLSIKHFPSSARPNCFVWVLCCFVWWAGWLSSVQKWRKNPNSHSVQIIVGFPVDIHGPLSWCWWYTESNNNSNEIHVPEIKSYSSMVIKHSRVCKE